METTAKFSFWIDKQGGTPFELQTTVGLLWIATGLVTGATGVWQLYRGASFRWRRMLAVIIPLWVIATLAALLDGKTANLTGVLQGTLALATPITLGAFAGILSERSGLLNIAIDGKFLIGACVASVVASVARLQLGDDPSPFMLGVAAFIGGRRRGHQRHPRRAAACLAGHPLEGRPDHRRRRHRHRRARDHELPVPAGAVQEHRAQHAADDRGHQAADPGRHPGRRADPVQPDAIRLLHVRA